MVEIMRNILVALVCSVLMAIGCSSVKPAGEVVGIPDSRLPLAPKTVIHCDTEFSAAERSEIEIAAEIWRRQTSGLADIQLAWDVDFASLENLNEHVVSDHNVMLRLESWMELADPPGQEPGIMLGVVYPSGGLHADKPFRVAFVVDRLGDGTEHATLRQVALHEFGHVLGVPHIPNIQGIMHPIAFPRTVCLKRPDLAAFCAANDCGYKKMYPCE